jgi:fucose 4-O-acetylase-like acetyltransferase
MVADKIRGMMILSVLAGLLAGFNEYIGEYFTFSRFLCLFPFFFLGYRMKAEYLERIRKVKVWVPAAAFLVAVLLFYGIYGWTDGEIDILYMKGPYKEAEELVIRAVQFLVSLLMIVVLIRGLPEKSSIFTEFGKGTYLIYMLNFYFVEILSRIFPVGVGTGWNAAMCFLYAYGAIRVMNSKMSQKIFDKMIREMERAVFRS